MAAASLSDTADTGPTPHSSANPLLGDTTDSQNHSESTEKEGKSLKKRLFGFGKKKEAEKGKTTSGGSTTMPPPTSTVPASQASGFTSATARPPNREIVSGESGAGSGPDQWARQGTISAAASPSRPVRSSSPRLPSPASSQIFERNVQEPPPPELSPAIPSHVLTEDHIPPALEASSIAITEGLNPDEVEVVMHAAHQPAAAAVSSSLSESAIQSPALGMQSLEESFTTSNSDTLNPLSEEGGDYADTTDPRRLSFISFADVVHAEHAGNHPTDPLHLTSLSLTSSARNRSPSPVRSPTSSHGVGPSPPTSGAPSMRGLDLTGPKSPTLSQQSHAGDAVIVETMTQALRSPASGDLGAKFRHGNLPVSTIGSEDGTPPAVERPIESGLVR